VKYVANSVIMQMLATSEKWQGEVMALNAGHRLARHAGVNQHGNYYVSTLSEGALDGTGARSYRDGDDTGHGLSCHNIEWLEANFPLLYLFRRNTQGGAGAGKYRGGTGGESALTVHDAPEGKIKGVALGVAGLRNSGQGLFGGYPGAPSLLMVTEGARVEETIAEQIAPDQLDDLGGNSRLLPYCEFHIGNNDILYMRSSSGGGYGDPLEREPQRVLRDVEDGIISRQEARDIYGVAIDGDEPALNLAATEKLRDDLRKERLNGRAQGKLERARMRHPLRENLEIVDRSGTDWICCSRCCLQYCRADQNWREFCHFRLLPAATAGSLMSVLDGQYLLRQLHCPSCAVLLDTDFVEKEQDEGRV
jgi:N-methylhydantoinase B